MARYAMASGLPPQQILKWREQEFYLWAAATERVRWEQVRNSALVMGQGMWAPEKLAAQAAGASRAAEPTARSMAAEGLARAASIKGRLLEGRLVMKGE